VCVFKKFKIRVKKEIDAYVTCLRTNKGDEFTSNEYKEFCLSYNINRQLIKRVLFMKSSKKKCLYMLDKKSNILYF